MSLTPHSRARPLEGLRILVADDVAAIRHIYSTALSRAGAVVTLAVDGNDALYHWKAALQTGCAFDALVLDYAMPGVDGAYVTAALRDVGFAGPIVGVSAELDSEGAEQWIECGCDEVLEKGISLATLVERVAANAGRSTD